MVCFIKYRKGIGERNLFHIQAMENSNGRMRKFVLEDVDTDLGWAGLSKGNR